MRTKVFSHKNLSLYLEFFNSFDCIHESVCTDLLRSRLWVNNKNIEIILGEVSKSTKAMARVTKTRSGVHEGNLRSYLKRERFSLGGGVGDFAWRNPADTNESFQPNRVGESARDELFSPVLHDGADDFAENGGHPVAQERIAITLRLDSRLIAVVPYDGSRMPSCCTQLCTERLPVATHLSPRLFSLALSAWFPKLKPTRRII